MSSSADPENRSPEFATHPGSWWVRILVPLLVLAVGVLVAYLLLQSGPKAKKRPRVRNAPLVNVEPVQVSSAHAMVAAMGTVQASREVELKPQVGGRIVTIAPGFIPGGHFRQGDVLMRIDPTDYQLAVEQLASDVARVEAELKLEEGNQLVAVKEYQLLGEEVSAEEKALMLRQPQLASLQAELAAARSRLEQARNDLRRTEIVVPFNALIRAREVDLGAHVNEGTPLAGLVGTDSYWVEVAVPVSELRWIGMPEPDGAPGSSVSVRDTAAWGPQHSRQGRVIGLAATLESQGRMARLLVEVADPLSLDPANAGKPRMLLDSYVRVEIEGAELPAVVRLPRTVLRDGDAVWILNEQNQLEIRPVEVVFRGEQDVLIGRGLEDGERLVISSLSTPVEGMALRLESDEARQQDSPVEERRP